MTSKPNKRLIKIKPNFYQYIINNIKKMKDVEVCYEKDVN